MISSLDDQQLSSMQSTSEFDDSQKELRQVECCVHGRPCIIASRLSREKEEEEEANRNLSSGSYKLTGSNYKSVFKKSEPRVTSQYDDISYNLNKKVEREALDIPIRTRDFRAPHLSTSTLSSKSSTRISEIEDHTGRRVERLCLSKTLDVPSSSFTGQVDKLTTSKKSYDEYEMMPPTTVTPRLMSKEQAVLTARTPGSMELPPSVEAYIGVLTAKEAEEYVMKPASFKLYHMMPKVESLNNVLPSLSLYIIYRSGSGVVQYGDPMAPWFFTLDALVNYYNVYVHLHEVNGECIADIFPVNGMQNINKSYQYISSILLAKLQIKIYITMIEINLLQALIKIYPINNNVVNIIKFTNSNNFVYFNKPPRIVLEILLLKLP
uniref:SH2 domain-containing protein n=2 Tax=Wuchereria bancrofti TaxID=6293 RepID=A0A1I8ECH5_WUCBA